MEKYISNVVNFQENIFNKITLKIKGNDITL